MRDNFINFTLLSLFSIYILYLRFVSNSLQIYTGITFLDFITFFAVIGLLIGIFGMFYLFPKLRMNLKNLGSIVIFFGLIFAGLFVNIFFLLIAIIFCLAYGRREDDVFFEFIEKFSLLKFLIFLVIITGILLPSTGISSITAEQRFSGNTFVQRAGIDQTLTFGRNTLNYSIGDWIASFNFNPNPAFYEGKKVKVSGFIFRPSILDLDYFMISRFIIRCCAADATPVGINVYFPNWIREFKIDDWVEVVGEFTVGTINDLSVPIIKVTEIKTIDKPSNPYIY